MKLQFLSFLLMLCGLLLAACTGAGTRGEAETPSVQVSPRTYVFECGAGYRFIARIEGETAWLFLPGSTVSLPQVSSGSGAKYSDGRMTFWNKGDEALLETAGKLHRNCRNNRAMAIWEDAKLSGVDFRAVGKLYTKYTCRI